MDYKQTIIDELSVLQKKEQQERNVFKARAYGKVIGELKLLDRPVRTMDDIADMPGVGDKIRAKIQEILQTGVLRAAEVVKKDSKQNITQELMNIYAVGPVKAKSLVADHNIRTIEDLRNLVERDPKILNDKQKVGLRFYEDLQKRIPREEMKRHEILLKKMTPKPFHMDVVGSYRREMPTSGDIDVLIGVPDDMTMKEIKTRFHDVVNKMKEIGYIQEVLALGPKKCMAICKLPEETVHRRLDLLVTPPEEYPYAILYFTGSDKFNIKFRKTALEHGYTMNEHGMKPVREGVSPAPFMKKEEDIFKFLEIPYVKPNMRT